MAKKLFAAISAALAAVAVSAPAMATTLTEEVALCAAAADTQGLAAKDEYWANFVSKRGAATKRLTIELIPHGSGEVLTAECSIRRGEVIDINLKA